MPKSPTPAARARRPALLADARGAILIEAALTLPILVLFLIGILTYGTWFMAAHVVQQAANEGARAALAGLTDGERTTIVAQTVTRSLGASTNLVSPALVATATQTSDGYYTVTVTYDAPRSTLFGSSLIPLPPGPIRRASVVKLSVL
ncbi:pilus assembly protein [Sphingobium sufflavum]|uniref:TadE/TadG family type IV pilus assembly protein n=1 Tax=Sphingobium sufflavum TaxID=1129547 RepID=UPI001F47349D|nr:TadE/TadG family type IV pilus assembly protein [Sphingobium sufflavum]MCE7796678.1 pilus assembly protein [Sphingobium sufflavum]